MARLQIGGWVNQAEIYSAEEIKLGDRVVGYIERPYAAEIRRAVDSHEALLASLRDALPMLKGHQETPEKKERYQRALAAVAKAEGK